VARRLALHLALVVALARPASATWSIVMVDPRTREVAVGSVTCLDRFDLRAITPVVLVGRGGATVQAAGDFDGVRRPIIHDEMLAGTAPDEILARLATVPGHEDRQYGIVDVQGRATTFTGSLALPWAGGLTGDSGAFAYAIQGNILTGACVASAMEAALIATPGDMPAKLMAAMEAARDEGGDGRCSCDPDDATRCGCPPVTFTKSGHIGYMIDARIGDTDDPACNRMGCADGLYCMSLNVAFQLDTAPDPVDQLRQQFDAWRAGCVGKPDGILSQVTITPSGSDHEMRVQLLDWQGTPVPSGVAVVTVAHEIDSAGVASIGPVVDLGAGASSVLLSPGAATGTDRYRVEADDGTKRVVVSPSPTLCFGHPCDCDPGNPSNLLPGAAARLRVAARGDLTWAAAPESTSSNVHSGELARLLADGGLAASACLAPDVPGTTLSDARPLPGGNPSGYWYVVGGRNGCGDGPLGTDSAGVERVVAACP
jgi:uncharacterized Ntn-hydrolase superfamily protein